MGVVEYEREDQTAFGIKWEGTFASKVLFDTCAGCTDQAGWAHNPPTPHAPFNTITRPHPPTRRWVGQGVGLQTTVANDPRNMYLWTESKTCEAYFEPLQCKGFMEFDTCDLSSYPWVGTYQHQVDDPYSNVAQDGEGGLLKCDEGENLIGTNRMGYCVCSPTSPNTYNTFSNPFFCGHSSSLNCYQYCAAARRGAHRPYCWPRLASPGRRSPWSLTMVPRASARAFW